MEGIALLICNIPGLLQYVQCNWRLLCYLYRVKRFSFLHSIMGVHVNRLRERATEHALEKAANPKAHGVCPYSAHQTEDKSIYETLMSDDRVSNDLCANIIMALFRTGIDSVGLRLRDSDNGKETGHVCNNCKEVLNPYSLKREGVSIHTCIRIYIIYAYVRECLCACARTHAQARAHAPTHTHTHARTHARTHTHTRARARAHTWWSSLENDVRTIEPQQQQQPQQQ